MKFKILVGLTILGVLALISGSFDYRFRGEEPTRLVMAYEMDYFNNFSQPTYLGENYYRKPPLFNWLIIASSKLVGWNVFTARILSIISTILIMLLIYILSKKYIFYDKNLALLSSLTFLSFIDTLFWYGFLAEIDMTYALFEFFIIFLLFKYYIDKNYLYIFIASIFTGLAFLIKGFPAFVFFTITFVSIVIYELIFNKKVNFKFILGFLLSTPLIFLPILVWIINLPFPEKYISVLWNESFNRVESSKNLINFFTHLIFYPIKIFKGELLISLLILLILIIYRKNLKALLKPKGYLTVLIFIFLINFIPYWISAGARVRYILPIVPILAIYYIFILKNLNKEKAFRWLIYIIGFSFSIRILVGLFYYPYETHKKGFYKKIAVNMLQIIPKQDYSKISSNCIVHKGLIFYLDIYSKNIILSENKRNNWKYFISCRKPIDKKGLKLLKTFKYKNENIYLYTRF